MAEPTAARRPFSLGSDIGPYQIVGHVGAGGMGEVFRARDGRLGRDVAIKVLPESLASEPERQRRFELEARAVAALDHPNVLVIHDVGAHEGTPYLVTELLDGESLRERLRGGKLAVRKAVDIAIQIARGLSAAHDKGIVHRDLKPENVFVTRDGRVKVLDFGLARFESPVRDGVGASSTMTADALTSPGTIVGTLAYMAPEQARGRPADVRSDVFALGSVVYEMLAGRRAFSGATAADLLSAILREDPPAIEAGSALPPVSLERVVRRCLEKEPAERFQTARDVGFALEALSQVTEGSPGSASRDALATVPGSERAGMAPRVLLSKAAVFGLGVALTLLGHWLLAPLSVPRIVDFRPLTGGSHGRLGVPATDGERVYFTLREGLETRQMALSGGASAPVKVPFPVGYVVDASKARSSLLMVGWDDPTARLAFEDPLWEGPLWSVPMPAGGARKMGLDASWAAWSPDGQRLGFVRYSLPSQLAVARADGSEATVLFESSDHLTWVRWSPDGARLRFGLQEADTAQHWIMEIPASGGTARRLYPGFRGDWSPDGRAFIFSTAGASAGWGSASGAGAEGRVDLVAATEPPAWRPWAKTRFERLTFGPMNMRMAAFAPEGRGLVAWGSDWHGQLMRYDAKASRFEPLLASLAAGFVDYSRDGRWIVWVDVRELTLWRSRSDGSEPLQLTTAPMAVGVVRWSPDGRQLAFVGKPPDSLPRVYVMPSDGGVAEPISPAEKGQVWDPCWMPDGKSVVWGRIEGAGIRTFDLQTRKLAVLPQTDDLFYPKCSSQGLLLALTQPRDRPASFWTYDPHSGRREDLGVPVTLAYPTFSRDGGSVIGCSIADPGIYRFTLRQRRLERLADLGGLKTASPLFSSCWVGLDPEDAPIVLSDTSTYEVYSLAWERP